MKYIIKIANFFLKPFKRGFIIIKCCSWGGPTTQKILLISFTDMERLGELTASVKKYRGGKA